MNDRAERVEVFVHLGDTLNVRGRCTCRLEESVILSTKKLNAIFGEKGCGLKRIMTRRMQNTYIVA